jgi:hypothetical protein
MSCKAGLHVFLMREVKRKETTDSASACKATWNVT